MRGMATAADDTVPCLQAGHAFAHVNYGTHEFVPQHRSGRGQIVHEGVNVGAADGGISYLHHHLAGTGMGSGMSSTCRTCSPL